MNWQHLTSCPRQHFQVVQPAVETVEKAMDRFPEHEELRAAGEWLRDFFADAPVRTFALFAFALVFAFLIAPLFLLIQKGEG